MSHAKAEGDKNVHVNCKKQFLCPIAAFWRGGEERDGQAAACEVVQYIRQGRLELNAPRQIG